MHNGVGDGEAVHDGSAVCSAVCCGAAQEHRHAIAAAAAIIFVFIFIILSVRITAQKNYFFHNSTKYIVFLYFMMNLPIFFKNYVEFFEKTVYNNSNIHICAV